MVAALKDVQEGKYSVSSAARIHQVPRRTLEDRVKGRVVHGTLPGPSTVLTNEEEKALVAYLIHMAKLGFPLTPKMTCAFAWAIAMRSGKEHLFSANGPSKNWFTSFRKRHSQLSLRKMDNLERSRAEALNPEVVRSYFELLDKVLTDNGIKNSPRQIYNTDETFIPLNESKEKAVTVKNTKTVYSQSMGSTEHITLLCAGSATGTAIPPMIIYPKAFPGGQYKFGGPDYALYARSDSGWVDSELFFEWMKKVFIRYIVPERPVFLLVDGHKSHLTIDLIDLCRENEIILFCLPPHTTHALQPLDVSVFKALKAHFARSLRAFCFTKKNFMVSKRDFSRVLKEPFEMAFSMTNIKQGFKKCGVFPFNPNAVDTAKMAPSSVYQSSSASLSPKENVINDPPSDPSNISINSEPSVGETSFTPSLFSTPASTVSESSNTSITNPLVKAGLVPGNLADILETSDPVTQPKCRVIKARVLTEDEYFETLKDKEKKGQEAKEKKEKNRIEREKRKEEKAKEAARRKEEREKKRSRTKQETKEKTKRGRDIHLQT